MGTIVAKATDDHIENVSTTGAMVNDDQQIHKPANTEKICSLGIDIMSSVYPDLVHFSIVEPEQGKGIPREDMVFSSPIAATEVVNATKNPPLQRRHSLQLLQEEVIHETQVQLVKYAAIMSTKWALMMEEEQAKKDGSRQC